MKFFRRLFKKSTQIKNHQLTPPTMKGYLLWSKNKQGWKRNWFVLKDRVLYTATILGHFVTNRRILVVDYHLDLDSNKEQPNQSGMDFETCTSFQLVHNDAKDSYVFETHSSNSAQRWIEALLTILDE